MDALQSDFTFGVTFMGIGIFCYLAALTVPFFYREYEEVDLELELN